MNKERLASNKITILALPKFNINITNASHDYNLKVE
jgi:hypothetical protein